jgi:hypothetical protein
MQGGAYLNLVALMCWTTNDHVVYGEAIQHNSHLPERERCLLIKLSKCCAAVSEQTPTDAKGLLNITGMGGAPSPWSKMPPQCEEKGW